MRVVFRVISMLAVALCAFGAVGLSEQAAHAKRGRLLVLQLEAEGFDRDVVTALDSAIREEAARDAKLKALPKPALDFEGMALAAGCSDPDRCAAKIGETLGARRVLRARLEGSPDDASLQLELVTVATGEVKSEDVALGDVAAESAGEVRVYVAALFGVVKPLPPGAIALVIQSDVGTLDGATIRLDGDEVPEDRLGAVEPGMHDLAVEQAGFETFEWSGEVRPGRTARVGIIFEVPAVAVDQGTDEPTPGDEAVAAVETERDGGGPRVFTWVLGGTAVAAGVMGTVFGVRKLGLQSDIDSAQQARNNACRSGDLSQCNVSVCDDLNADDCSSADTAATVATVSWVLAGVLAAGSIAAFFLEAPAEEPAFSGAVVPTKDGANAAVRIRF